MVHALVPLDFKDQPATQHVMQEPTVLAVPTLVRRVFMVTATISMAIVLAGMGTVVLLVISNVLLVSVPESKGFWLSECFIRTEDAGHDKSQRKPQRPEDEASA